MIIFRLLWAAKICFAIPRAVYPAALEILKFNIFRGIHGIAVETYIRLIDEGSCFIALGSRAVILLDYWVIV